MYCMQAPYEIKVTGPSYLSLLDISNAQPLSNVTNGTIDLRVAQPYQNLEPDYGNRVNVTLVLSTSSQVSTWHRVTIVGRSVCTYTASCLCHTCFYFLYSCS